MTKKAESFDGARIAVAHEKFESAEALLRNSEFELKAITAGLLNPSAHSATLSDSMVEPLETSERIEKIMRQLDDLEAIGKAHAARSRELGKVAEHIKFGTVALYRDILARGDAERARRERVAAEKQRELFPAEAGN